MQLTARTWVAATVVIALLLTVAAWFVVINPVRADAADLRSQAADTVARNERLTAQTKVLRQQFANLPDKEAELAALQEALPAEVELPTLIRTVDGFASQTGVTVMSIAPGVATPVVDPSAASAAAVPTPAPTESAAPTDGATTAPTGPVAPAGPVTMSTPLTTTVIGDFFDAQAFLRRLQADMPRAFLVRDLSVTAEDTQDAGGGRPATTAGDVTMTITADVFSRLATADAAAKATPPATPQPSTPASPAPGVTPTPGGTPAPTPGPAGGAPPTPPPGSGAPLPSQQPAAAT